MHHTIWEIKKMVVAILEVYPRGLPKGMICKFLKKNAEQVTAALTELHSEGKIRFAQTGGQSIFIMVKK